MGKIISISRKLQQQQKHLIATYLLRTRREIEQNLSGGRLIATSIQCRCSYYAPFRPILFLVLYDNNNEYSKHITSK